MEVRPARVSHKERVPGQDKPRLRSPAPIRHQEADAVRRVTRGVEDRPLDIPQVQNLSIFQRPEGKGWAGRLVEADRGTRFLGQGPTA